jgi:hypothetical protein
MPCPKCQDVNVEECPDCDGWQEVTEVGPTGAHPHDQLCDLLSTMTPASVYAPGVGWQAWTPELGHPPFTKDTI